MDLTINKDASVAINIEKRLTDINIGEPRSIDISVSRPNLEIKVPNNRGLAFEFVQKVVGGTGVIRLTYDQFKALDHLDGSTWYAVTTTTDELRYLYLGASLIAQASQEDGTWGFAYTFPMTFGR